MVDSVTNRCLRQRAAFLLLFAFPLVALAQPQLTVSPSSFETTVDAGQSQTHILQLGNSGDAPLDFVLSTGPGDVADSLFYDNPAQTPQMSVHSHAAVRFQAPHDFTLDAASVWVRTQQSVEEGTIEIAIHPFNPAQSHYPISLPSIGGGTAQFSGSGGQRVQIQLDAPLDFEAGEQFFIIAYVDGGRVGMTSSGQPGWNGRQYYDHQDNGWNIWVFGPWAIRALSLSENQVLTSDTGSGTIPAGGQLDVTLTANAADLVEGTYNRPILITLNDPLADSLSVPFTLHVIGVSHLEISANELDFGTVVAGQTASRTLTLGNSGTAPLSITGAEFTGVAFSSDPVSPLDPPVMLGPDESISYNLVFSPEEPGSYAEILTIASDAANLPDAPVSLSGAAQPAPELVVEPGSIDLQITSGQTEAHTILLSNPGEGELQFFIDRFGIGLGDDSFGYRWIESTDPGGPAFEWVDIRGEETRLPFGTGTQVAIVEIALPFPFQFYGETYDSLRVSRHGGVTFSDEVPYFGSIPRPIPLETWPNNFIAPFWKNLRLRSDRGGIYAGTDDQGRFVVQWQELQASANLDADLTFQLILDPSGDIHFQYLSLTPVPISSNNFSVGMENHDGTTGLQLAFNDDGFIRNNLAVRIAATPQWIANVEPASGIIPQGGGQEVSATFDPGGLLEGSYHASIAVNSNAPTAARVHVPVAMEVMGVPQLSLSTDLLDFEEVFMTYSDTRTLTLSNTGTVSLTVSDISVDGDEFSIEPFEPFTLAPAESREVPVTFAPETTGSYGGSLVISSNDPENSTVDIELTGNGIGIPQVATSPGELDIEIASGDVQTHTLEIGNPGESDLHFSLGIRTPNAAGRSLPDGAGTSPVGADSIVYDTGASEPGWMFGLSHTPLSFAVRFTAPYNFSLSAIRAYFTTDTSSVNVQVEIYRKGDGPHPSNGQLLASWTLADLVPEAQWVYIPLPASLVFAEGDEFFAVLHFDHVTFPMGQHYGGPAEYWGRSSYKTGFSEWLTVGPRWMLRALTTGGEFITADPAQGTVPAGETVEIDVIVDATGLSEGTYSQELVIASNDPETPELVVPVTVDVEAGDGGEMSVPLSAGWNLVSWSYDPPNRDPAAVLADVLDPLVKVKSYRDGHYVAYTPGAPAGENTLNEMDPMYSYWIKMSQPAQLWVEGLQIENGTPLPLNEGLNAITYLSPHTVATGTALASVMDATQSAMAFAGTGLTFAPSVPDDFQTLVQMQPMSGYYLHATSATTLIYPPPTAGRSNAGGINRGVDDSGVIDIDALRATEADAGVTPTMEWVAVWGDEILSSTGAQLPLETLVTARTADGLTIGAFETVAEGRVGLMSVYGDDPTTEEKDGALPGEMVTIYAEDVELATIEWTAFGDVVDLASMVVSGEPSPGDGLPLEYALDENYPNPFNAGTTIRFALPEAGPVVLSVYDMVGRRVATIIDEERTAGWHNVNWDAGSLASGVYIYRIEAGAFSKSQRMVIVR